MTRDKNREMPTPGFSDQRGGGAGSRARNRTEMLTPEMTRQMRAEFSRNEIGEAPQGLPPGRADDFESPLRSYGDPAQQALPPGTEAFQEPEPEQYQAQAEVRIPTTPQPREAAPSYQPPQVLTPSARYQPPEPEPEPEQDAYVERYEPPPVEEEPVYQHAPQYAEPEEPMTHDYRYNHEAEPQYVAPTSRPNPPGYAPVNEAPVDDSSERAIWVKPSPLTGFLVSYDRNSNGEYFELRNGRLIVSSELGANGNIFYVPDESVSAMHAIMRIAQGQIQVLDQLSEAGTRIKKAGNDDVEHLSGDKGVLEHGDTVWFGDRRYHVCLVGPVND